MKFRKKSPVAVSPSDVVAQAILDGRVKLVALEATAHLPYQMRSVPDYRIVIERKS